MSHGRIPRWIQRALGALWILALISVMSQFGAVRTSVAQVKVGQPPSLQLNGDPDGWRAVPCTTEQQYSVTATAGSKPPVTIAAGTTGTIVQVLIQLSLVF